VKLHFFATDTGVYQFVFAPTDQRAVELFSLYLVLAEVQPSRFWFREMRPGQLMDPHREPLRDALSRGVEGFGEYTGGRRWTIRSLEEEFG
jgi:hypothetical protein